MLAQRWAEEKILLEYQTLAIAGRGRGVRQASHFVEVKAAPNEICGCVGRTPTISPEGDFFPCCSAWANTPHQRIGSVHETGLSELVAEMERDPIVGFMNQFGPKVLVEYLKERGHDLPDEYSHPCDFCETVLERYDRESLLHHVRACRKDRLLGALHERRGCNGEAGGRELRRSPKGGSQLR